LTAIDCLASLELGANAPAALHDAVVVEQDGHPYALLVDSVEDVIEHEGEIHPLRGVFAPGWTRIATGMVEVDGSLMLLADPAALIAGPPTLLAA
jgi:purine-binding chemotaxis protein CheW